MDLISDTRPTRALSLGYYGKKKKKHCSFVAKIRWRTEKDISIYYNLDSSIKINIMNIDGEINKK